MTTNDPTNEKLLELLDCFLPEEVIGNSGTLLHLKD
jgi:hypothetical protein